MPGQLCEVKVPANVKVGQNFTVRFNEEHFLLTSNVNGGEVMRFVVPDSFLVIIPDNVRFGQDFFVDLDGERYTMTCPRNVQAGDRVRFRRPLSKQEFLKTKNVALNYGSCWTRRVNKKKQFVWTYNNNSSKKNKNKNTSTPPSPFAMVRQLQPRKSDYYYSVKEGDLNLVRAETATTDGLVKGNHCEIAGTISELATFHAKDFETKTTWISSICQNITRDVNLGIVRIHVRRENPHELLENSVDKVMSLQNLDLRKLWRFSFVGDDQHPADSTADEWFQSASRACLDKAGLWKVNTKRNNNKVSIDASSQTNVLDYLVYYRFFGRLIGRAIFDGHSIEGSLEPYLLKHILGLPLQLSDLEAVDEDAYKQLVEIQQAVENGDNVRALGRTFTIVDGDKTVELMENGADTVVTKKNYLDYFEKVFAYKLLTPIESQLTQILLGVFEIIPEPLLAVFDETELDRVLCHRNKKDESS